MSKNPVAFTWNYSIKNHEFACNFFRDLVKRERIRKNILLFKIDINYILNVGSTDLKVYFSTPTTLLWKISEKYLYSPKIPKSTVKEPMALNVLHGKFTLELHSKEFITVEELQIEAI